MCLVVILTPRPLLSNLMQTATIYCRRSSESGDSRNLAQQREDCERYAAQRGIVINDIVEQHYTGTVALRVRHPDLWSRIESGEVKTLIVSSVDRLSRATTLEALSLIAEIKRAGCVVHGADIGGEFDPDDINTIIRSWASSQERGRIVERMMSNKRRKAASGWVGAGPVPYGYKRVGSGRDAHLEIIDAEAAIVRRMYQMSAGGMSLRGIANRLNLDEIKAPGGGMWQAEKVRLILIRTIYSGVTSYDGITARVDDVMIVTPAQFEAAQVALKNHSDRNKRNQVNEYLLKGHIYCECGKKMYAAQHYGKARYMCSDSTIKTVGRRCRKNIMAHLLDPHVVDYIKWSVSDEALALGLAYNETRDNHAAIDAPDRIANINADIAKLERSIDRLMHSFGLGDDTAKRHIEAARASIADLERERLKLLNENAEREARQQLRASVSEQVREMREYLLHYGSHELTRELVKKLEIRVQMGVDQAGRFAVVSSCIAPEVVYRL